ncbi:hypothetical protein OOU_Y34scaffold01028g8 [Pyricularia oryzae Y34]|nr:hypothetical protein OOU_Y34scaffold01028g8 [Pyricularia oryzae Y34]
MATNTSTELQELPPHQQFANEANQNGVNGINGDANDGWGKGVRLGDNVMKNGTPPGDNPSRISSESLAERDQDLPHPTTTTEVLQRWNHPRSNIARLAAAFWAFIVAGANDAAYGPLIPYLEEYYNLSYLVVSLVFLSPFIGYTLSALCNNYVHLWWGQRGVALISPSAHLAAYIIIACHPPYPVLVVAFSLAGFGNGLVDAAWNAWIGNMARADEILGFLHGFYGVGAVVSPLIATSMITRLGQPWWAYYYLMIGLAGIELVTSAAAFWPQNAQAYRDSLSRSAGVGEPQKGALREVLFKKGYARVAWLISIFLLCYVGAEVAIGGWIVKFMMEIRNAPGFESGMSAMGFWLGLVVGRVILGFVTPKLGVKLAVTIYLIPVMALQLVFWLVPQFYVSVVAVALQGFFIGPLFPAAIVVATKLLPKHLHVSAIGFAAAFGGSGAAVLPFAIGAIAQAKGVWVLQPIILALFAVLLLLWLCLPRLNKKRD